MSRLRLSTLLAVGGGLLFAVPGLQAAAAPARPANRPNIVLFMVDDLGIGDVGVYNPASKIINGQRGQSQPLDNCAGFTLSSIPQHATWERWGR